MKLASTPGSVLSYDNIGESESVVSCDTSRQQVQSFLQRAKYLVEIGQRYIQQREATRRTVAHLTITYSHVWDVVLGLSVDDYVSGPQEDDNPRFPGSIWVFGVCIEDSPEIYLKLKMDEEAPQGLLVCLSFHFSDRQMRYPYRCG